MTECSHCGASLRGYSDIAVHGGSVDGSGYVSGTFPCPECDERLEYNAKMCQGYPK